MVHPAIIVEVPLAPQVLYRAGVPIDDALWLNRLPAGKARFQALRSNRGEAILQRVRTFAHQLTSQPVIHMAGV
jgi:hypothetical protein